MTATSRLSATRLAQAVVRNPVVFHLLFTSFVKPRFATQTRILRGDDWQFLNLGYETNPPMALPLTASDEPNRIFIQQYHHAAAHADLAGKRVLEVSCGHGGGASYLTRTMNPSSYTGLDLNPVAIDFCRSRYRLPGLDFLQGSAEHLPFGGKSFDVVINLEASHLYRDVPRFFAEVARVLVPGGHFVYTDFRPRGAVAEWDAQLAGTGMRVTARIDVAAEVLRGNEKNLARKQDLIARHSGPVRFASKVTDWAFNDKLRTGELSYLLYCLTKE